MAYKPNIPAATDKLSTSQADLQGNFQAIDDGNDNAGFAKNHVGLNQVSNVGKHKEIDVIAQGSDPTVEAATEGVIYNKQYTGGGSPTNFYELWYVNNSRGGYPITGGKKAVGGWAYIGGGNLVIWGTSSGIGDVTITPGTKPASTPAFANIYHAQVTTWMSGTSPSNILARLKEVSGISIVVFCSNLSGTAADAGFYYYIIGSAA